MINQFDMTFLTGFLMIRNFQHKQQKNSTVLYEWRIPLQEQYPSLFVAAEWSVEKSWQTSSVSRTSVFWQGPLQRLMGISSFAFAVSSNFRGITIYRNGLRTFRSNVIPSFRSHFFSHFGPNSQDISASLESFCKVPS